MSIIIFAGHYGSGKTEIAVNFAMNQAKEKNGEPVTIVDMDIVNPYFRTKDVENILLKNGIKVIAPNFAGSNIDVPSFPPDIFGAFQQEGGVVIVDVGGDPEGATALGSFRYRISGEYTMYFVINTFRPMTTNPEDIIILMREIEAVSRLKFSGIINNTNLKGYTTKDDILNSLETVNKVSRLTGLNVDYICAKESLAKELESSLSNILGIKLYLKQGNFEV